MATSFHSPQTGLKSWDVFVSIRKGECRCVPISGRTLGEAWKTLQLDPGDVVMAVCERSHHGCNAG
jgi:hypothetical protein